MKSIFSTASSRVYVGSHLSQFPQVQNPKSKVSSVSFTGAVHEYEGAYAQLMGTTADGSRGTRKGYLGVKS